MNKSKDKGTVIWITGLSGAGKTTVAQATARLLRRNGVLPVLLDGDAVREVVQDPHTGYDRASRLDNAKRICRLAKLLADQGQVVLVATMSLFSEIHQWNREHLPRYREIYLKVDTASLVKRDARGLYSRFIQGEAQNVVGQDLEFEAPTQPDLLLINQEPFEDPEALAQKILESI